MRPDIRSGNGDLEIDRVRAPFADVVPTKIMRERDEVKGKLVLAGSTDIKAEFPRMRAEMLREVFQIFATRQHEIEPRIDAQRAGGFRGAEAVFVATLSVFEDCLRYATTSVPAFMRIRELYDVSHNGRGFALGEKSGVGELLNFTCHGVGVMMGLFEVVPDVFEAAYGRRPTSEELRTLIPGCTDRMMNALSRVTGAFAVDVETEMGMQQRYLGYENSTYPFAKFDPKKFALRTIMNGPDVLDVTRDVATDVRDYVEVRRTAYHGCLAGLVKISAPEEASVPPPTVFAHMKQLTSGLMLKHAFPEIR